MTDEQVTALVKQARALTKQKDYAQAILCYEEALVLAPNTVALHESVAALYFAKKDDTRASEHFHRAAELDPQNGRALINLGAVYNRMAEHQKAAEVLRKGIARDKSSMGFYNLGIAQKRLGQPGMAVSAYREAIRLDPRNADAHLNLGNVLLEMKNIKQAVEHYQSALQIRPEFPAALRGLAKADATNSEMRHLSGAFGRLVGEGDQSGVIDSIRRELSEGERFTDRKSVYEKSVAAERAATELADYCKRHMEDGLSALVKGTAVAATSTRTLSIAHDGMQEIRKNVDSLRQELRRRMLEMRAHEELMNSPDLSDLMDDE